MRISLIVDSACDLPDNFIEQHNIIVLPMLFSINGKTGTMSRDDRQLQTLYQSGILKKENQLLAFPIKREALEDFLQKQLVGYCELAIVQTISSKRAANYHDLNSCLLKLSHHAFKFRVMTSQVLSAGQGVLAAHCTHLIKQGMTDSHLRRQLDFISDDLYNYSILPDTEYTYVRGKIRGEKTINPIMAKIGKLSKLAPIVVHHKNKTYPVDTKTRGVEKAFNKVILTVIKQIHIGLKSPFVCISYAGNPKDLESFTATQTLRETCYKHQITLLISTMGFGCAIELGKGSICVGFAASKHALHT